MFSPIHADWIGKSVLQDAIQFAFHTFHMPLHAALGEALKNQIFQEVYFLL